MDNLKFNKTRFLTIILSILLSFSSMPLSSMATRINADAVAKLSETAVPVSAAQASRHVTNESIAQNQRTLPVIMYHQVLKSRKSRYIITPKIFENDLIELKNRGYCAVLPSQVIAFVEGRGELPKKPVMLTFDDGHYNNLYYCHHLLKKHGFTAVVNVVGEYCEKASTGESSNPMYSYLTWAQAAQMAQSGVFEIGNHTYNMHETAVRKGVLPKCGESDFEYENALKSDVMRLQNKLNGCGVNAQAFAYPFGSYCVKSRQILLECGFKMLFTCTESRSVVTAGKPQSLHQICRFNRSPTPSSKAFIDKIEKSPLKTC